MNPHWSQAYVGLPWCERGASRAGCACWGLACLVYVEQFGITLPDFAGDVPSVAERASIAEAFARGRHGGPWGEVSLADARPFDILVFRRGGLDAHVGIVVALRSMLHITSGMDSAIVNFTTGYWAPRLSAVYRHAWTPEVPHVG